ncbi:MULTISPECIES: MlaE family ABC transporter permease [unclassified Aureimonas]|uniref:MlaE family ABC transporter permease n=1 Tax=unclassified Aureimonas TaxID=2615206 RepID=UPI0006F6218F|nr:MULTISPECIES: ABC transporter permease [unclassified Aureimonas]KQT57402.1 organic solvent ABC transporter permease [Aureimonas sp. Leaf427]KQT77081.1 organic solvent ABC transporter permease [Aureimonas sp. Leaf460]
MLDRIEADERRGSGERPTQPPALVAEKKDGGVVLQLSGDWLSRTIGAVEKTVVDTGAADLGKSVTFECGEIGKIDTSGAFLVERLSRTLTEKGATVSIEGVSDKDGALFDAVKRALDRDRTVPEKPKVSWLTGTLDGIGRYVAGIGGELLDGLNIIGASIYGAGRRVTGKQQVRLAAIVHQMDKMGVRALPIISLMSFLIGAIIAQQGAFQLRNFGAEIFVVDLVGILQLREIGVLLTAIMIAGRSGSAITAEIGSMKMREEVDALQVIGLNPIGVLVFPRLVALTLVLPLLAFVADIMGLGGAILITWTYSGIPPAAFIQRLREAVDIGSVLAGLIKAPFMAIVIGVVASAEGMKVGGSAESLGAHVTTSVVKSIFLVILVDAFFAIFYSSIGF